MFFEETILFPSGGQDNYRIPSLIVTNNGTVLAFCTNRIGTLKDHADEIDLVCAVKRPGECWGNVRVLAHLPGWRCNIGSAVYDPAIGRAIVFFARTPVSRDEFGRYTAEELAALERRAEDAARIATENGVAAGLRQLVSDDDGAHFIEQAHLLECTSQRYGDIVSPTHGSAHGICLRHGAHAGRLICPARTKIGNYSNWNDIQKCVYNNAIYSDDHGKTWRSSQCVQAGTGEGTLIERADGSILYNSRAYFNDGKRYLAVSEDGGETYGFFSTDPFLRDVKHTGCNASFLRVELHDLPACTHLPKEAQDLVLFCNPRAETRARMTACVSVDSGAHFHEARVIFNGPSAYSSLDYDKNSGHFHLLYEKGDAEKGGSPYTIGLCAAEFDLEWLLQTF